MLNQNFFRPGFFHGGLRRGLLVVAAGLAVTCVTAGSSSAGVVVDGSATDWGIASDFTNLGLLSHTGPGYSLFTETIKRDDQWGPGGGGQPYDAEWMGLAINGNTLYLAIVSGVSPANGPSQFGLGDILLKINGTEYGIETGGSATGAGGVVNLGDQGAFFTLDGNGYTVKETTPTPDVTAGSIWQATQGSSGWVPSTISGFGDTQLNPDSGAAKTPLGNALQYVYSAGPANGHSVIELSIDLSLFGTGPVSIDQIHWGPACGNDYVELNPDIVVIQDIPVPEPASVAIWLVVGAGFAVPKLRRSRTKSAKAAV